MSFVKAYSEMLDSSIWGESSDTRVVWITLLLMADADGAIASSVGGLARRANVTREAAENALEIFLGPDPDSRDGTTGERIEKCDGGWRLINHRKYKDRRTKKQEQDAERAQAYRDRKAEARAASRSVTPRHAPSRDVATEAEAEAELTTHKRVASSLGPLPHPARENETVSSSEHFVLEAWQAESVRGGLLGKPPTSSRRQFEEIEQRALREAPDVAEARGVTIEKAFMGIVTLAFERHRIRREERKRRREKGETRERELKWLPGWVLNDWVECTEGVLEAAS